MKYEELTDRELDALVAEKVFSGKRADDGFWEWPDSQFASYETPKYTNSLNLVFEVIEAMRKRDMLVKITADPENANDWVVVMSDDERTFCGWGNSLPRAICFAALSALDE